MTTATARFRRALPIIAMATALEATSVSAGVNVWTTNWPTDIHPVAYAIAVDPLTAGTLYAATDSAGVLKSTDAGGSWTDASAGLTNPTINTVAIDPSRPATLYAGTDGAGAFRTVDGGRTWTAINNGLPRPPVLIIVVDPFHPDTVYAGTDDGLFKSQNRGETWVPADSGLTNKFVISLAIDPTNSSTLYAGTDDGVFKSTDAAASWSESLPDLPIWSIAVDPVTPTVLYAAGLPNEQSGRVLKSSDGGATWNDVLVGHPVVALVIDPSAPATVYAGSAGTGVLKTTNGGASWTGMNAGLDVRYLEGLVIDPTNSARLYAASDGGVYEYTKAPEACDAGRTVLCLDEGRFRVTAEWSTPDGATGLGRAVTLTADSGYFTFFDDANVELVVKVLNGCGLNGRFWTFAGGLTNVEVALTVLDTRTGDVKTYVNAQGTAFEPVQDTDAFATCGAGGSSTQAVRSVRSTSERAPRVDAPASSTAGRACIGDETTLCLKESQFEVQAQWFTRDGATGPGHVLPLTSDTGAFWFFSPGNVEVVVKVLDGCGLNSRYWAFAAGLTDVNVVLTVTDTQTGATRTYVNPQGTAFRPIQDTNALATCP